MNFYCFKFFKCAKFALAGLALIITDFSACAAFAAPLPDTKPQDLTFSRLAVRRFEFSQNILLCELIPSETVSLKSMYPAFAEGGNLSPKPAAVYPAKIEGGLLIFNKLNQPQVSICVGGVNPYATCELDVENLEEGADIGLEFARLGLGSRVQVLAANEGGKVVFNMKVSEGGKVLKEEKYDLSFECAPFKLYVQLYGRSLGVFADFGGGVKYIGHTPQKEPFPENLDFRNRKIAADSTFNIVSNLKGKAALKSAKSYLSSGIGQADIRMVTNSDSSPYFKDGRLWFTFSARGLGIAQSAQGVMSFNPSVFDLKFEGLVVFDHGDGLLRNDYASHLIFDAKNNLWRAISCDFGGTKGREGRSGSGLVLAESAHCPLQGFSVMRAQRLDGFDCINEDPCLFYDDGAKKWRLLTSAFMNKDIVARMYEADSIAGPYKAIAGPIKENSTGTVIQKIGGGVYVLSGGKANMRVHSYPNLEYICDVNFKLQPHWPAPAGRVWANIVPLPAGFPYRYVLMTMDRPNFPNVKGPNWSYGALHFYGAYTPEISGEACEF